MHENRIAEAGKTKQESAIAEGEAANILSTFPPRKIPILARLWRGRNWNVISGSWSRESLTGVRLNAARDAEHLESMAIFGPRDWKTIELRARFRFLTDTIRPPDGGAILFFLARNQNNHLAFHYCVGKNKVQLFKKAHGVWTLLSDRSFEFQLNREYVTEVRSHFGIHECVMDDGTRLRTCDLEIPCGCIGIGGKYCDVEFSWLSFSAT
jgi:hypothetical protein